MGRHTPDSVDRRYTWPVIRAFDPASRVLGRPDGRPAPWVHADQPTPSELEELEESFGFPAEFLRHALDVDELARLDRSDDGAWLAVFRVPWVEPGDHDLPLRAAPVACLMRPGQVVTIASRPTDVIERLLARRDLDPAQPHRLFLQLVLAGADAFLAHLREIEHAVDRLEDEIQSSLRNRELLGLLRNQKSLVHFTTALRSDLLMLERLERDPRLHLADEDRELLQDVVVELRQAIEVTSISEDILSQMMDAFATLISNNLNVVMKVLTSLTILLAIPSLVASFYGMNVGLPFQHHPAAFGLVLATSVSASALVAIFFWRRRWL
jgi:magnesium transporter